MQDIFPEKTEEQRLAREKIIVGHTLPVFYLEMFGSHVRMHKEV